MPVLTQSTTFTVIDCPSCAQLFAITAEFERRRRADHKLFYCPSGHNMAYDEKNETEKLRAQLDQVQADRDWYKRRNASNVKLVETERRRSAAARGQLTKMRNRITNGVCPVPGCKRSGFDDVLMHIAIKHPDFHAHEETA